MCARMSEHALCRRAGCTYEFGISEYNENGKYQPYQETGGVVEEAAETATEALLQGRGVFWGGQLGVVAHHAAVDVLAALLAWETRHSQHLFQWNAYWE